jgi:hypothetical protein
MKIPDNQLRATELALAVKISSKTQRSHWNDDDVAVDERIIDRRA